MRVSRGEPLHLKPGKSEVGRLKKLPLMCDSWDLVIETVHRESLAVHEADCCTQRQVELVHEHEALHLRLSSPAMMDR